MSINPGDALVRHHRKPAHIVGVRVLRPVYLRQAEILERRGETADALQRYTSFLARWKDADPEYAPLIRDVRSRVERLSGLRP